MYDLHAQQLMDVRREPHRRIDCLQTPARHEPYLSHTWEGHAAPEPVGSHNVSSLLDGDSTGLRLQEDIVQQREELEGTEEDKNSLV